MKKILLLAFLVMGSVAGAQSEYDLFKAPNCQVTELSVPALSAGVLTISVANLQK